MKQYYEYCGPVMKFNILVAEKWYGSTHAESERKAKSNLAYQYKREHGLNANVKIILPGNLKGGNENG